MTDQTMRLADKFEDCLWMEAPMSKSADQAYRDHLREARKLSNHIDDYLAGIDLGNDKKKDVDWADAGDMQHIVNMLRKVDGFISGSDD